MMRPPHEQPAEATTPQPRPPAFMGAQRAPEPVNSQVPAALIAAALAWAVLATAWFSFVPTVREKEGELVLGPEGKVINEREERTFIDAHGEWVIPLLLVPIALAAVPLVRGRSSRVTTTCGTILVALCLIAGFSIGLYYMPSALLLLIGAGLVELRSPARSP